MRAHRAFPHPAEVVLQAFVRSFHRDSHPNNVDGTLLFQASLLSPVVTTTGMTFAQLWKRTSALCARWSFSSKRKADWHLWQGVATVQTDGNLIAQSGAKLVIAPSKHRK